MYQELVTLATRSIIVNRMRMPLLNWGLPMGQFYSINKISYSYIKEENRTFSTVSSFYQLFLQIL